MWTALLWLSRLLLVALLYVVLWRIARASSLAVYERSLEPISEPSERASTGTDGTDGRSYDTSVVVRLGKRPESTRGGEPLACRLLVLDYPSGGAPRGKRDVYATGEEVPVHLPFRIGRMSGCDVVTRDRYSSGMHARLYERGAVLYVEDLGSTNGTYVNGARVKRKAALRDGDVLQIGETSFLLKR